MKAGPDADALYLDRIVELIQLIREGLEGVTERRFLQNRDQADATALRLSAIGEFSRKLSESLKERRPEIDWAGMYRLRNIVAHHYNQLDYRIIWSIATQALGVLDLACQAELAKIDE